MRNYFGSGAKTTDHATSRTYQAQDGDIAPDMPSCVKRARPAIRSSGGIAAQPDWASGQKHHATLWTSARPPFPNVRRCLRSVVCQVASPNGGGWRRVSAIGAQPTASATNSNRRCAESTDLRTWYQAFCVDDPVEARANLVCYVAVGCGHVSGLRCAAL